MPATPAPPVLPPSWTQVLEKIEASLAEQVRATDSAAAPATDCARRDAAWREALARLDDRLAALDDCAGRAARAAVAADAALTDGAAELDRWVGGVRAALRKVADGAGGAV